MTRALRISKVRRGVAVLALGSAVASEAHAAYLAAGINTVTSGGEA